MSITPKQRQFVNEYLLDLNATQAAKRAGYLNPNKQGPRLLVNVGIQGEIALRQQQIAANLDITPEKVVRRWWDIANADPNDLVQYRRVNCRHCHGEQHEYQWADDNEFQRACEAATRSAKEGDPPRLPSDAGGYGFQPAKDPHPDCLRCNGEGHGEVFAADTRKLTGGARLLYDGVKQTKEGLEIKMQDRGKALENIARHLGMFKDKVEINAKVHATNDARELTDAELFVIAAGGAGAAGPPQGA